MLHFWQSIILSLTKILKYSKTDSHPGFTEYKVMTTVDVMEPTSSYLYTDWAELEIYIKNKYFFLHKIYMYVNEKRFLIQKKTQISKYLFCS